jgi:hypothetical protein
MKKTGVYCCIIKLRTRVSSMRNGGTASAQETHVEQTVTGQYGGMNSGTSVARKSRTWPISNRGLQTHLIYGPLRIETNLKSLLQLVATQHIRKDGREALELPRLR